MVLFSSETEHDGEWTQGLTSLAEQWLLWELNQPFWIHPAWNRHDKATARKGDFLPSMGFLPYNINIVFNPEMSKTIITL